MGSHLTSAPPLDCGICARLACCRRANAARYPEKWNAPVPAFGALSARGLVVGLAPGLRGANFTGRPFTGDGAGDALFAAMKRGGLARGRYAARADDGLRLVGCRITNAVRCWPPANKPTGDEVRACNIFLAQEIAAMPKLRVVLTLGRLAHGATLRALGHKPSATAFAHGASWIAPSGVRAGGVRAGLRIVACYHPSRYNINTKRLTLTMLDDALAIFARLAKG